MAAGMVREWGAGMAAMTLLGWLQAVSGEREGSWRVGEGGHSAWDHALRIHGPWGSPAGIGMLGDGRDGDLLVGLLP